MILLAVVGVGLPVSASLAESPEQSVRLNAPSPERDRTNETTPGRQGPLWLMVNGERLCVRDSAVLNTVPKAPQQCAGTDRTVHLDGPSSELVGGQLLD